MLTAPREATYQGAPRQAAKAINAVDREPHASICLIAMPSFDNAVDHLHHLRNEVCCLWLPGGRQATQGIHVEMELVNEPASSARSITEVNNSRCQADVLIFHPTVPAITPLAQVQGIFASLCCPLNDLVINISEVPDIVHLIPQVSEVPVEHIKGTVHTSMTCRKSRKRLPVGQQ